MQNAVIYARFSSDMQREESIEAQERACRDYAAHKDINIIGVYADEAVSGKTANRAAYQKMLRDCQKKTFDTILVHKYDRIGRNLAEHVNLTVKLNSMGVDLIAVAQDFGNGAESKLMKALMWAMSEYYVDNLANETRKGLKENALKGLHNGGVAPFGYDVQDGHYIINELEAEYVRRIFDAALHRRGFKDILQELSERDIRGKRGKPIRYTQIYEMLRNVKYTGCYVYSEKEEKNRADRRTKPNAIRIENALPIIIEKAVFDEVQVIMNERKQTGRKADYLCSGLVYCGECGAKMHATKSTSRGMTYNYYGCSKRCGAHNIEVEKVDAAAIKYLHELLSPENQKAIADAMRSYKNSESDRVSGFKAAIAQKIADKQTEYDNLSANFTKKVLPPSVVADLGQKMQLLIEEIEALRNTEPPKDYTVENIKKWLSSLKEAPDRDAVQLLIERIDIKNKTVSSVESTLKTVLGETGWGSVQHILPTILFYYNMK